MVDVAVADAFRVETEHVIVLPCRRCCGVYVDACQIRQVDEGAPADGSEGGRQIDPGQVFAAQKGEVADTGHADRQNDFRDIAAQAERHVGDLGDVISGTVHRDAGWHHHLARGIMRYAGIVARTQTGVGADGVILGHNWFVIEVHRAKHHAVGQNHRGQQPHQGHQSN